MAAIRVIYVRGHTLAGLAIRHHDDGTARRWSHCGIVDGRMIWHSTWPGGVRCEYEGTFVERYTAAAWVDYQVSDEGRRIAMDWLRSMERTPYPLATVLGRIVGLHIDEPGMQCTELVESTLAWAGLQRWRGQLHLITPNMSFANRCGGVDHVPPLAAEMTE